MDGEYTTEPDQIAEGEKREAKQTTIISRPLSSLTWTTSKLNLRYFAQTAPLVAAFISPLSFLLDIPALSQVWFDGLDTPAGSYVLSALGLMFDFVGNSLLLLRFSTTPFAERHWRLFTNLSSLSWLTKNILAIVNIAVYTETMHNGVRTVKSEGWWAALFSILLSSVINLLLLINVVFISHAMVRDSRLKGRRYLGSLMALVGLLALEALAFSQLEGWTYIDALYFATVSALTIGYGDYTVSSTGGRALLFFFLLGSIILLAQFISVASEYAKDSIATRRAHFTRSFEYRKMREAFDRKENMTLDEEMSLLRTLNRREESRWQGQDMLVAFFALGSFWLLGAGLYTIIEGWPYRESMYFVYCLFLTVGYGDVTPVTACGKTFFILYALAAVPIVTTLCLTVFQEGYKFYLQGFGLRSHLQKALHANQPQTPISVHVEHSDLVVAHHRTMDAQFDAPETPAKAESPVSIDHNQSQKEVFNHMMRMFHDFERDARM